MNGASQSEAHEGTHHARERRGRDEKKRERERERRMAPGSPCDLVSRPTFVPHYSHQSRRAALPPAGTAHNSDSSSGSQQEL